MSCQIWTACASGQGLTGVCGRGAWGGSVPSLSAAAALGPPMASAPPTPQHPQVGTACASCPHFFHCLIYRSTNLINMNASCLDDAPCPALDPLPVGDDNCWHVSSVCFHGYPAPGVQRFILINRGSLPASSRRCRRCMGPGAGHWTSLCLIFLDRKVEMVEDTI